MDSKLHNLKAKYVNATLLTADQIRSPSTDLSVAYGTGTLASVDEDGIGSVTFTIEQGPPIMATFRTKNIDPSASSFSYSAYTRGGLCTLVLQMNWPVLDPRISSDNLNTEGSELVIEFTLVRPPLDPPNIYQFNGILETEGEVPFPYFGYRYDGELPNTFHIQNISGQGYTFNYMTFTFPV